MRRAREEREEEAMSGVREWGSFLRSALRPEMLRETAHAVRRRLGSSSRTIGLRRDLMVPFVAPEALVELSVRQAQPKDLDALLDVNAGSTPQERWDRATRRRLFESGIGRAFVAVGPDDEARYVQWMFSEADNDDVSRHFGSAFPKLDGETALLEGAYTPSAHRGKRIMSAAMAKIAEEAASLGCRWVITFVGEDNAPSLKGCERAGFHPYCIREDTWKLFRRTTRFSTSHVDTSVAAP
jgi:GNAT superfamily N-acetyltransferase